MLSYSLLFPKMSANIKNSVNLYKINAGEHRN